MFWLYKLTLKDNNLYFDVTENHIANTGIKK